MMYVMGIIVSSVVEWDKSPGSLWIYESKRNTTIEKRGQSNSGGCALKS